MPAQPGAARCPAPGSPSNRAHSIDGRRCDGGGARAGLGRPRRWPPGATVSKRDDAVGCAESRTRAGPEQTSSRREHVSEDMLAWSVTCDVLARCSSSAVRTEPRADWRHGAPIETCSRYDDAPEGPARVRLPAQRAVLSFGTPVVPGARRGGRPSPARALSSSQRLPQPERALFEGDRPAGHLAAPGCAGTQPDPRRPVRRHPHGHVMRTAHTPNKS